MKRVSESVAGLTPIEVVERVIEHHQFFKAASHDLEASLADESAAIKLTRAYHDGKAPPWMTAHLLGCIGHRVGFETVKNILLDHPGSLAEDYAGVALARIAGPEATQDLLKILFTSQHIKTRRGAGYGLAYLAMPKLIADFERALDERCLPLSDVAQNIADCGPEDDVVNGFLDSADPIRRRLGCYVVEALLVNLRKPGHTVAERVVKLLEKDPPRHSRRTRELLQTWASANR